MLIYVTIILYDLSVKIILSKVLSFCDSSHPGLVPRRKFVQQRSTPSESGSTRQTSPRDDAALQGSCSFARAVIRASHERLARECEGERGISRYSPHRLASKGEKRLPAPSSCSPPSDSTPLDSVSTAEPSSSRLLLWPTRMGRQSIGGMPSPSFRRSPSSTTLPLRRPAAKARTPFDPRHPALGVHPHPQTSPDVRRCRSAVRVHLAFSADALVRPRRHRHRHPDKPQRAPPSWGVTCPKHLKGRPILTSQRKTRFWRATSQDGGTHPECLRVPTLG